MEKGKKYDAGKIRWSLLPWKEVEQIVEILTFGAQKYGDYNWQKSMADQKNRYFSALMRHLTAWFNGERCDKETGKSHLSHAGCCLLFMMWLDNKDRKQEQKEKVV